jgi:glycerol kinase
MKIDSGYGVKSLRVDGGATRNGFLMQFQADILDAPLIRPRVIEATARGAALLAGLAVDFWDSVSDIPRHESEVDVFTPAMSPETRRLLLDGWRNALGKS